MTTPGLAPSTPASHDPAELTTLPFSYSLVFSPRYHTFPQVSWAYQSKVFSTRWPFSVTTSWTTVASMPRIFFLLVVTVTVTFREVPRRSLSSNTHLSPRGNGRYGLSIPATKSAGSRVTGSLPWGSCRGHVTAAVAIPPCTPPMRSMSATPTPASLRSIASSLGKCLIVAVLSRRPTPRRRSHRHHSPAR